MGVLSWLALVALVVYRTPTASAIDDVIVHVVSLIDDKDILQNVTDLAMERAAIKTSKTPSPQEGDCLESRLKEHKKIGLILITKDKKCMDVGANTRRLLLSYDAAKRQFTTDKGEFFNMTELGKPLDAFVARLIVEGKPVLQQTEIRVPVFAIVLVGVLVGLLLAFSCIFFSLYRAATSKIRPIEKPNWASSKGGSSQGTSGKVQKKGSSFISSCPSKSSSKRDSSQGTSGKMQKKASSFISSCSSKSSSSKSKANSSKGKKRERKESCRSSKSLATKTCDISGPSSVKVISFPSPKQKQNNVFPPSKGEATSGAVQPVRDLERVRAPATVPKPCCGPTVPRPSVITTQPRPASKGPPIVPTVSVIGHAPSPFAVLAQATTPIPPASTPAILSSAPTAYSNPALTTVATSSFAPTVSTSTAPLTTVAPPPPPVSLASTVSLSSVEPVAVTPSPFPSHPPPVSSPSIHKSTIPISPAYSLASTPRSSSPSSPRSTREKAPISRRSQKK